MAQRAMLTHADVWNAVDRLAARAGLSASGLAKRAGLDPTTFNRSKRVTPQGRPRWPSTESIAKSLQATGVTLDSFVALISDRASAQAVPLIALTQAGAGGYFDDGGLPSGKDWDEIAFPAVNDMPATRDTKPLSPEERQRISDELAAIRDRQEAETAATSASAAANPATAAVRKPATR